jgi:hypothetical protein
MEVMSFIISRAINNFFHLYKKWQNIIFEMYIIFLVIIWKNMELNT